MSGEDSEVGFWNATSLALRESDEEERLACQVMRYAFPSTHI